MSKNTILVKIKKFNFPVDFSTGKPISTTEKIDAWFSARVDEAVERRKGDLPPPHGRERRGGKKPHQKTQKVQQTQKV